MTLAIFILPEEKRRSTTGHMPPLYCKSRAARRSSESITIAAKGLIGGLIASS